MLSVRYRETGSERAGFGVVGRYRLSGAAGQAIVPFATTIGDVLWSPDSRSVALSLSGGGLSGVYDLFVLGRSGSARPISSPFRRRLHPPPGCDLGRFSNVAAVAWLSKNELLVVARQAYEDNCVERNRARFFVYDVAKRRIRRSFTLPQARRAFGRSFGSLI